MAGKILIIGPSGSGKSTSYRNLNPASTFIICCDEKELPFKGWKANYKTVRDDSGKIDRAKSNFIKTSKVSNVSSILNFINDNRPEIKVVIIDTFTMMMINDFMSRIRKIEWQDYRDIAANTYDVLKDIDKMREDLMIIVMSHMEFEGSDDGSKSAKFKVPAGKLIGGNLEVEGMFTTVLYTSTSKKEEGTIEYWFETQTNTKNTAKSPMEMFPAYRIPNDLKYILRCYSAYENGKDAPSYEEYFNSKIQETQKTPVVPK